MGLVTGLVVTVPSDPMIPTWELLNSSNQLETGALMGKRPSSKILKAPTVAITLVIEAK